MLAELRIQNFAIIQELTLTFSNGLVVLTGETGAGKSIILDALNAVLGGRVDVNDIRRDSDKAVIEASFALDAPTAAGVRALLEPEGLWEEDGTLSLSREIRAGGRSVARVNGRSVSLSLSTTRGKVCPLRGNSKCCEMSTSNTSSATKKRTKASTAFNRWAWLLAFSLRPR